MTAQEIEAVARRANLDKEFTGKMVFVTTTKDGVKLYMGNGFQPEKRRAFPYHYDMDKVGDQVFQVALQGIRLDVELADKR